MLLSLSLHVAEAQMCCCCCIVVVTCEGGRERDRDGVLLLLSGHITTSSLQGGRG